MFAILGELCWLEFFKTVYLETSNVRFGSFFQNPVTFGEATASPAYIVATPLIAECLMPIMDVSQVHLHAATEIQWYIYSCPLDK